MTIQLKLEHSPSTTFSWERQAELSLFAGLLSLGFSQQFYDLAFIAKICKNYYFWTPFESYQDGVKSFVILELSEE